MNISELKAAYKNGTIDKANFIDEAYKLHSDMFSYMETLKESDIEEIKILSDSVIFTTKRDKVKFSATVVDKRIAPIETLNFDEYEQEEQAILFDLVSDGDIVFDIGANIGWYSLSLSKRYPNCKIYSFEPLGPIYKSLTKNIELNSADSIKSFNFGLSNKKQMVSFFYDEKYCTKSSEENLGDTDAVKVECKLETMDQFTQDYAIEKIDFVKCDVEGAELFCMQGAIESIKKYKPIIFLEMLRKWAAKFDYHPNDIINLLKDLDYLCFGINSDGLIETPEVNEQTFETNYIFFHKEKHVGNINEYRK